MKTNVFIFLFFFAISLFAYNGLDSTFYQQDEWHSLGMMRALGIEFITESASFFDIALLNNRPLARLAGILFLSYFPLQITPLVIYTLILHTLNGFILYLISNRIVKSPLIAIFGTIFFLVNDTAKQAVLWASASIATIPSGTGILLSILFYLRFLERRKAMFAVLSIVFLVFSLGFKDNALFLVIFLPLLDVAYQLNKKRTVMHKKLPITIFLIGTILIGFKIINVFFLEPSFSGYVSGNSSGVHRLIWAGITFPIETVSQLFIPDRFFYPFSLKTTFSIFPYFEKVGYAVQVSEKLVLEILSILATFIFIIPLVVMTLFRKDKFPLFFSGLFYIVSFLPFLIIVKSSAYFESRYYYTLLFPVVIFLGIVMKDFMNLLKKFTSRLRIVFVTIFLALYFLLIIVHMHFIQQQISLQKERATVQKSILASMYGQKPELGKKQIFYFESDRDHVIEGNPLPFYNGLGYTILVFYIVNGADKNFKHFLTDNYFWELGNQGYKEKNGVGFGYYTDLDRLKHDLKKYNLGYQSVTAFSYNSESNELLNISAEIRKRFENNEQVS